MKKCGICLLPDAFYLSELNVPGKPNRTNLGECAAIQRFLSTHPNENLAILTPYRNQRALLAGTAKKSSYPQEVSLTVHRAQGREWDTCSFSFNEGKRHWDSVIPVPLYLLPFLIFQCAYRLNTADHKMQRQFLPGARRSDRRFFGD